MFIVTAIIDDNGKRIICEFYDKHFKKMLYTATQLLGRERGEEAVHDVFVKIIEKFEKNPETLGDKPGHFFVIVVRNHSLDLLRKERLETVPLEDEYLDHDFSRSQEDTTEGFLINVEAEERLAGLIRKLTPATRQVLEYKYIEGYSNIEIADMLNLSQTAVSTRIDKAKKRLKGILESEVAESEY